VKGIFRTFFKKKFARVQKLQNLDELSHRLGYSFRNKTLLKDAMKHRSILTETGEDRICSNERLELLGDSVLGLLVVEYLFRHYPEEAEGNLTTIKSLVDSRRVLSAIGKQLELGRYIMLNKAEERAGGRNRSSIISDAFEAVIGAIYLDGGLEAARKAVESLLISHLDEILNEETNRNYKSILLEYCQGSGLIGPDYRVIKEDGPDHRKMFTIAVSVDNKELGVGKGFSKKKAEQLAAREAVKRLKLLEEG